jgi:hypothetical protein
MLSESCSRLDELGRRIDYIHGGDQVTRSGSSGAYLGGDVVAFNVFREALSEFAGPQSEVAEPVAMGAEPPLGVGLDGCRDGGPGSIVELSVACGVHGLDRAQRVADEVGVLHVDDLVLGMC